jgi:hypothetical protein
MIAALYVERGGPYFDLPDVDPWDLERDARLYDGPYPVVAHPPCGPWGELRHLYQGDEHDCAPLAIDAVRRWGGVLEHPRRSMLWSHCECPRPGDLFVDRFGGWTIDVAQVDWGHVARKWTRLYFVGVSRSALTFPEHRQPTHWISGFRSTSGPNRYVKRGSAVPRGIKICSAQQRRRTPRAFAEWLVGLARSVRVRTEAA